MSIQSNQDFEKQVFGQYEVLKKLPFRIIQAPYRKFSKYQREGHWNQKERLKYTVFLGFFQNLLQDPQLKKKARIYEMMSDMIITRNPSQCRSHHQKMEKYRNTIRDIIASVTEKYEPSVYEEIKEKYTIFIKTLLQNSDKYVRLPTPTPVQKRKAKLKKQLSGPSVVDSIPEVIPIGTAADEGKKEQEPRKTGDFYQEEEAEEEPQQNIKSATFAMKDQKKQQLIPGDGDPALAFQVPWMDKGKEIEQGIPKPAENGQLIFRFKQKVEDQKSQECLIKQEKIDTPAEADLPENLDCLGDFIAPVKEMGVAKTGDFAEKEVEYKENSPIISEPLRSPTGEMYNMWGNSQPAAQIMPVFIPYQNFPVLDYQAKISDLEREMRQIETNIGNMWSIYNQKQMELNYYKNFYGQGQ